MKQAYYYKKLFSNKFCSYAARHVTLLAVAAALVFTSPAFASGTPYGSGPYGSGTYNGTSSASSGAGGASSGAAVTPPASGSTSTPAGGTNPTTTSTNPPAGVAPPKSINHHRAWLIAGIAMILLAIGLFIWLAVRRRRKHNGGQNPPNQVTPQY
jgi:hypothetical protein